MKKLFFGLACVIGMMFFASCTQEQLDNLLAQKPTIEFVSEDGFISGNTGTYVGTELKFKVRVAPNESSKSELSHFDFSIVDLNGNVVFNENPSFDDPNGENFFVFSVTPQVASTFAVTASITDKSNKANAVALSVNYVEPVVEGIGTFEGTVTIDGHYTTNEIFNQVYDEDQIFEDIPTTIVLGRVNDNNRVSATLEVEGTPVTLYGTMNGNVINFDEFVIYKVMPVGISGISITSVILDLTMNMTGTLDNGVLSLEGNTTGYGKTAMDALLTFEATFEGEITGSLTQVTE